jgi:hypothetical protein
MFTGPLFNNGYRPGVKDLSGLGVDELNSLKKIFYEQWSC